MYRKFFKRSIDLVLSSSMLVLLFPVFMMLVLLLLVANRGNPFFVQLRPGKKGHLFRIIKFKTMNERRDQWGSLLPDGARITPVGRWVRKSSLDELPQLLNVIKGDMSLVGPRPLLPEYLALYDTFQWRRHEVKPGITGWAQVNGRNAISWKQKFAYDVHYVERLSFGFDLYILWLTFLRVIRGAGVNQSGQATTTYFSGNNDQQLKDHY